MDKNRRRDNISRVRILWLSGLILSGLLCAPVSAATENPTEKSPPLLNSIEFRGPLTSLVAWRTVIDRAREQLKTFRQCQVEPEGCDAPARSWQQVLKTGRTLAGEAQLQWVNRFFNRWPYRLDPEAYGLSDYWASPLEFMKFSGDCEDYSISKYFALRQLGYPASRLRIVVVKDSIRNLAHAMLAVYLGQQVLVLDSISDPVLPQQRYTHYLPQYSVNEKYRWAHIRSLSTSTFSPEAKGSADAEQRR